MRKGRDGGENEMKKKEKKKKKIMALLVATTSLPAVYRPNADRWNAARSRQFTYGSQFSVRKNNLKIQCLVAKKFAK